MRRLRARGRWRALVTVLACAILALAWPGATSGPARAIPPAIDPALLPPAGPPRSPEPAKQATVCQRLSLSGPPPRTAPPAQRPLDLPTAWRFSRGRGQIVAVIDTGVTRHPRLPRLIPGGDYVAGTDGTEDCDGHGTLVAGLIAGQPSADDGFTGVAPEAAILAIRQVSLAFEPADYNRRGLPGQLVAGGFGTTATLASAIVHAVALGATVITVPTVACAAAGTDLADGALGAAVRFAYDRNVVVVAAAGDLGDSGSCRTQNDETGLGAVRTVASPAHFTPYVLSVGAMDGGGAAAAFSLFGSWVSVAAPGRGIISLDSAPGSGGLVDSVPARDGVHPIEGTGYAAAYVAGVVALVRSRYPELTAGAVMERVIRTAHSPGPGRDNRLGAGLVDPVAALTARLPERDVHEGAAEGSPIAAPEPPPWRDPWPVRIALIGTIVCLAGLAAGHGLSLLYRRGEGKNADE
ncbi:type VII secretion-associated serine protease mycosin [Nocardia flavorosea]|uniref:type VII secretion-associated serine protease mycosin n=1 Tax=Nocardia flavorosea TaxID=53429 RepID=UPI001894B1FD|nr:type VII secretion-associated serine protease mycosin [Nocardia flavorosea]MBF6351420.1 type VII secretion-associated serine protease mycosin [Nocardia flavorosea]